jgi:GH15 family glucan-1,4-alpha-glucosidase
VSDQTRSRATEDRFLLTNSVDTNHWQVMRTIAQSTLATLAVTTALTFAPHASGAPTTQHWLVTGNGRGFQIYEKYDPAASATVAKLVAFYDYPFRYLRSSGNTSKPGVSHRNLLAGGTAEKPVLGDGIYFGVDGTSLAGVEPTLSYVEQSHILQVDQAAGSAPATSYYFAPFNFPHNASIALLHAPGATAGTLSLDVKIGVNAAGNPTGEKLAYDAASKAYIESGTLGAVVYVPLNSAAQIDCNAAGFVEQGACDESALQLTIKASLEADWMGVAILHTTDATKAAALAAEFRTWQGDKTANAILDDAKLEFASWRVPVPAGVVLSEDEQKLWRQSEAVLRMGQVQTEGGSKGLYLAGLKSFKPAPDFADWSIPWTRDAMYAIVPMAMIGHVKEARDAVQGMMLAPAVGQPGVNDIYFDTAARKAAEVKPYRISVTRYFGDGAEESDLGNSQWDPGQDYNVEVDGWGLYLWAVRQYLSADPQHAREWLDGQGYNGSKVFDLLISEVARPLEVYLDPADADGSRLVAPDASIWEDHNNAKARFAYTTLSAARGFCDLAAIVSTYKGDANDPDAVRYREHYRALEKGLKNFKRDPNDGLRSAVEHLGAGERSVDGAVVEAYNFGMLRSDQNDPAYERTLAMIDSPDLPDGLLTAAGGFRRRNGFSFDYEYSQWGLLTFRASEAYLRQGNTARAGEIFGAIMDNAKANYFVLPELYKIDSSPPGAYYGSRPMVGYAAGAFIMYVLTRAHLLDPTKNYDPGLTATGVPECEVGWLEGGDTPGGGGAGSGGASSGGGASSASGNGQGVSPGGGASSTGAATNAATPGATQASSCLCSMPGARHQTWQNALALAGLLGLSLARVRRHRLPRS